MENVETAPGLRMSTISTSIAGDYRTDQVITRLQLEIGHGKLTNESIEIFYSIRTLPSLGNTQVRTNLRTDKKQVETTKNKPEAGACGAIEHAVKKPQSRISSKFCDKLAVHETISSDTMWRL